MRTSLLTFCLLLSVAQAGAQLHILRTVAHNRPSDTAKSIPVGMLASTAFIGELQRGFGSLGGDQAWNIKVGGVIELYRWQHTSLLFTAASELTANPYNDLGFNPRTASWEEQLFLGTEDWQAALFHRCKHEIDNTDPPNADTPTAGYRPVKRVLIVSGIAAGWSAPVLRPVGGTELRSSFRAEWYALHHDYRTPANSEGRSWEHLRGSLMASAVWEIPLEAALSTYLRLWGSALLFGGGSGGGELNARVETGLALKGGAARMDVFVAWERLFDEPASIVPTPTKVLFIGARLGPGK